MADKTVMTELIVDARGAEVGSAAYVRAMKAAQTAIDRQIDRTKALDVAMEKQAAAYVGGAQSIGRVAGAWDRLRSSIDPVAAAEIKAQKAVEAATIAADNAVKRGLATEIQAAEVLQKLKQQQVVDLERVRDAQQNLIDTQIAGTKVANNNSDGPINSANVAAQFQDVFVTAQMGMNPLQIALQQGTQLSAVLGPLGAAGAVKSLGAAFMSLVNPVTLVTLAAVAGVAALIQWAFSAGSSTDKATDSLKLHDEWLAKILTGYEAAADAAQKVSEKAQQLPQESVVSDLTVKRTEDQKAYQASVEALTGANLKLQLSELDLYQTASNNMDAARGQADALLALQAAIDPLNPDLNALHANLTKIKNSAVDDVIKEVAAKMLELVDAARQTKAAVDGTVESLNSLQSISMAEWTKSIGGLQGIGDSIDKIKQLTPELRSTREIVNDIFKGSAGQARTTSELQALADAAAAANDALTKDEERKAALKAANSAHEATPAEKFGKSTASTEQQIASLNLEAEALDKTSFAATKAKVTFDLLNAAKEAGLPIDADVTAQIDTLSTAMADAQLTLEGLHEMLANRTPWEVMGEEIERLQELLDKGKISNEDYVAGVGRAVEDMVSKYASGANNVIDNLEKITDAMGLQGKAAFDVQKTISIARAVVAGGEAIVHAYNAGMVFGLPGAIAFAGIAAAATGAQIAAIASTTYQSKSAPSASTGGSGSSAATTAVPRQSTLIQLVGNSNTQVSLGDVKSLLDQLNDEASQSGMEIVTRFKGAA